MVFSIYNNLGHKIRRYVPICAVLVSCNGSKEGKVTLPPAGPPPSASTVDIKAVSREEIPTIESVPAIADEPKVVAPNEKVDPENRISATGSRLTGSVDAPRRSQIAFRQTGFIGEIIAKPGTKVKKGEVLANLDERDFKVRVDLSRAKAAQAKIQVDAANKDYQRESDLQKENASTLSALDKVQVSLDSAKIALRVAEIELEAAALALKDAHLIAPYDCVVAVQMKHEGEYVQSGNAVFEIYDTSDSEINLVVSEKLMGKVSVGSSLTISIPSSGFSAKGKVIRLVPIISEKTRTFQITAKLDSQETILVPGSYAEATLN